MSSSISLLTLCLIGLAIYLLWMDVGLYLELQKLNVRVSPTPHTNTTPETYTFSPFTPVTVKELMLSSFIQFIDEPLGYFTVSHTDIAKYFSANLVSTFGVVVAFVAAKFFMCDSLRYRQIGVLIFKVRDFIDALDGYMAREVLLIQSAGQIPRPYTIGWAVDGICDGLADIFRFYAFAVVIHRVFSNGKCSGGSSSYHLLDTKLDVCNILPIDNVIMRGNAMSRLYQFWLKYRKPIEIMMLISLQYLLSAVLWNYFIINYHITLETDLQSYFTDGVNYKALAQAQNTAFKSSSMWVICYFWRLVNPQNVTQIQLFAILYNKEVDLLTNVQLLGFIPTILLGFLSYIHLSYVTSVVTYAALS